MLAETLIGSRHGKGTRTLMSSNRHDSCACIKQKSKLAPQRRGPNIQTFLLSSLGSPFGELGSFFFVSTFATIPVKGKGRDAGVCATGNPASVLVTFYVFVVPL